MQFGKNFTWGAATAAYQIEGAAREDGKGLSIWDIACKREGYIKEGQSGDVACDHYHRMDEDVQLMKDIGLQGYRFSISWPRVMPKGTKQINEKGLDFYDRLVDELLENQIEPYVTLFHWDYPYELFVKGGWLNPDSSEWFAEYTQVVAKRLGDRVKNWFTINEPQCFIGHGLLTGRQAPVMKMGLDEVLLATHNTLLAHGKAVKTIRQVAKQKPRIGWAPQGLVSCPVSGSAEDIAAAREETFAVREKSLSNNSWWMDPVFKGEYPEEGMALFAPYMPNIGQEDMKIIAQPMDFFGANIYHAEHLIRSENGRPVPVKLEDGHPENASGWPVTFDSLYWGAKFFYERYQLPVIIAENGMPNCDWVHVDGQVHDPQRIDFLYRYIGGLKKAAEEGIPLDGYFYWSFMDNMEWMHGYSKRFGLVFVDYHTLKRTVKDSGYWYKALISSNGEILG